MSTVGSDVHSYQHNKARINHQVIADYAPVMMWMSQTGLHCHWFNAPWLNFTGRTLAQAKGDGWTAAVHPDDLEHCLLAYTKAFESRETFSIDYRLQRYDGTYRWVLNQGNPTYSDSGVFDGFVGTCIDIQERKDLEAELLKKSEALQQLQLQKNAVINKSDALIRLYETILSATPDLIYVFELAEPEPKFSYANEGLVQMLGRPCEQIVGKTLRQLGYEDWHAEMHHKEIDTVRSTKMPIRGEVAFTGTFGRRIYDYIFAPVFDSNGEVEAVAGTTRDVTEHHNTAEILKRNEEALQQANLRKDEFLAMLAHELRNPLAPISAATQIMSLSQYDEAQVRSSSLIIERQLKHLVGLVDDLLDVSRVTRGLVNIEKLPQDMAAVIASSLEQMRPLLDSKQHQLSVDLTSEPAGVIGDHKRLVQIVSNILSNAAKYTQIRGHIKLSMTVENGAVIIQVADNGIGISPHDQQVIFELFAQAKRSSDRSQGGLGIGLALVKSLLKLHDGTISCSSKGLGLGSQFTITLPLRTEKQLLATDAETVTFAQQRSVSILVVDDNVDAATSLASLIELYGHDVSIEHDSWEALDLVDEIKPMICILDIGLPKMDGYELARRIKAKPSMSQATLIAVTGYGQESDIKFALQSGFDHHLVKPVDYEKLIGLISDVAEKSARKSFS